MVVPALWKQKHADFCEFDVSLVYAEGYRTARTARRPVSRNKQTQICLLLWKKAFSEFWGHRKDGLERDELCLLVLTQERLPFINA